MARTLIWFGSLLLTLWSVCAEVLVPAGSSWRYFKGTIEPPLDGAATWVDPAYNDSGWPSGPAAFYYENQPGSANAFTGQTLLSDMFGGYTCVLLRRTFVIANPSDVEVLQVAAFCDDGFIAWINGREVARFNMPAGAVPCSSSSLPALSEPISWWTNLVADAEEFLVPGTNVLCVQAFNSSLADSSDFIIDPALYYTQDQTAPALTYLFPAAEAVVRQLTTVEVAFNEPVTGVDASDLLINGQPASQLTLVTPSQFVFGFAQPAAGLVQVAFAANHGIHDLSSSSNLFAGASWTYTLNPDAPLAEVIISEFMASNSGNQTNSLHDELGNSPDWIELHNRSNDPVSLTGWALTDNPARPGKWRFPPVMLAGKGYLVVFASGRDTNVAGQLHTSFSLSADAGYLALFDPAGNLASAFSPTYPKQFKDVSYGRDRLDLSLLGYYTNATPGAANTTQGAGFAPNVIFSRVGGTFQTPFYLALTVSDTNCEIRYVALTTNVPSGTVAPTNIPTQASTLYTGPLLVSDTVQVRARAFPRQPGLFPGPPRTENYLRISPAAAAFSSDLPVILLHNLAGGNVPQTTDQGVMVMVFEPVNGRTSLTNPPTLVARAGLNIRGSSTAGLGQSSFALELWDEYNDDLKTELLGMPAESDWVLYGQNGYDPSFLHNPLAHQLARDLGRYSSRTRFAEVFLKKTGGTIAYSPPAAGDYFGLYTIEEKIKRNKERVDIKELSQFQTTAPGVTGGYLLKIDRMDPDERSFYDAYVQRDIVFQDPKGLEMVDPAWQAQYNYIMTYFTQFGQALWGANYTNPVTGYAAYIDVNSWVDQHLVNAVAFCVDAFRLSGYFYKDREKKLEMGPSWDFDRSMGTYNPATDSWDKRAFNPRLWRVQASGDQGTDLFGNPALLGVRWWQRLFVDPDFWQRWIDRWSEVRREVWTTNHINALIDGFASQLAQAQPRQQIRWNYTAPRSGQLSANGYTHSFPGTFAGEIAFLKRWMADRVDFIDTNFLRAPAFSSHGGAITSGFRLTLTAPAFPTGTTIYYTLDGTDPRAPGGAVSPGARSGVSPLTLTLTNNARVFARNRNPNHSNVTNWPGSVGGNPPISSPWSAPTVATFVVATPPLVITEIMYHPERAASGTNDAGDFEFIELKNSGTQPLSLPGIRFTRGIQFTFTSTNPITQLGAGQYVVLVRNRAAFQARYPGVTNIAGEYAGSLDNGGEHLVLEGALGEPILDFEFKDSWQPVTDGYGFSLVIRDESGPLAGWTHAGSWRASTERGGSPGRGDPAPQFIPPVVINEVLTHTDLPELDTIELFNPTAAPAPVGGWFLTDERDEPRKYVIPAGTTIPAGGFLLFTEAAYNAGGPNSFALSSLGEEVYLFSGDGTNLTGYRHGFEFGAQTNGVTFGRHVSSDGREHLVAQKRKTLGGVNSGPKVGPVVINEIMYEPPPFGLNANYLEEFVELRNIGNTAVPLYDPLHPTNTWRLGGGMAYTFPQQTSLAAGSCALVVSFDPAVDPVAVGWFRSRYGLDASVPLFGPFSGRLANEGDTVALYCPDNPQSPESSAPGFVPQILVERVRYSSQAPWPAGASGSGWSLGRIASAGFGDDPANWQAAPPSPGRANPVSANADADADGLPDEWEIAQGLDPTNPDSPHGGAGDADGDSMTNWQEYVAGTSPTNPSDFLRFERVAVSGAHLQLEFLPRAGRTYALERRNPAGPPGSWTVIQSQISGTNRITLTDPVGTGGLYRLKVSLGGN